ncbi:hypothetical protein SAMN05421736_11445 [Evansella caseinilytica]|uniref:Uncharacterized protein n=1 Tax=Evansella caseinilytica TaxID=1503961 RepID=A0A1H3TG82_9BACI|nr:hypothetical protein SAMN05421736_11445 [Evansella caseinilytica]
MEERCRSIAVPAFLSDSGQFAALAPVLEKLRLVTEKELPLSPVFTVQFGSGTSLEGGYLHNVIEGLKADNQPLSPHFLPDQADRTQENNKNRCRSDKPDD